MITASIDAATCLFTGSPTDISASPDEYRSRIAPPMSPRIATAAKGIRYQVGTSVVSAPIGSIPIISPRSLLLPANIEP